MHVKNQNLESKEEQTTYGGLSTLKDSNPSKNGDDLASYPKNPQIHEVGFREGRNRGNGGVLSENVREGGGFVVKKEFEWRKLSGSVKVSVWVCEGVRGRREPWVCVVFCVLQRNLNGAV